MQKVIDFNKPDSNRINWSTLFFVIGFHLIAVAAFFTFNWANVIAVGVTWLIAGSWGIGIGYHRLLTHRGFKTSRAVEYFLAACGTLALQSGPLAWVTTHRLHHAFTETDKDPHSPRVSTYWAHIGWIFRGVAQNQTKATVARYCPDLIKHKFLGTLDKYYYATNVIAAIALFAIGGWSMVIWGIFLRVVIGWHATWLVNSATHLWGSRRFETRDDSRNNGWIAAVSWGEGWHNNHHAHPRSARHGLTWREFDANWIQIRLLEKFGLVKDVYAYQIEDTANEETELKEIQAAA